MMKSTLALGEFASNKAAVTEDIMGYGILTVISRKITGVCGLALAGQNANQMFTNGYCKILPKQNSQAGLTVS